MSSIILITGAKSGIGKGLLSTYASRPNTIAIAAIRDGPDSDAAKLLEAVPVGARSRIIVAKYDANSQSAGSELVAFLRAEHKINHLDVVVANAGILNQYGPSLKVTPDEMLAHFQINTVAPLLIYQAAAPLLNASPTTPKFFVISSTLGSNALLDSYPMPMVAYGVSKAAVNFVAGKIHREEEKIVVVPVHPGWVQTAMGEKAAEYNGMSKSAVPVTLDDSVQGLINVFDKATKEEHSGKFLDQNSESVPW